VVLPQAPGLSGEEQNAMTLALAERLRDRVGHLRVDDMGVTVSIGVSVFPEDGQTASDLVASADQALFGALALGGNRVVSSADDFDLGSTG
jgi:GGDEF domain-containing protein